MKNRPLPYARPSINQAERDAVLAVLEEANATATLTQGERLLEFERSVARSVGAAHAVACANATAALHLALLAAGVGKGKGADKHDRVLTQSVSFCATANAVRHCNAVPVFADIDEATLGLSPRSASEAAEKMHEAGTPVKAIVPVLMGGGADARNAVELLQLKDDLNKHSRCLLIEDAAHALGGYYNPEPQQSPQQQCVGCGAYADISVFSFHPIKPVTSAEGGVAVTNSERLAERMRCLRNHGREKRGGEHDEMIALGFNYRLSELHAALGAAQMKRLQPLREQRHALAEHYDILFERSSLTDCLQPLQRGLRACSAHHLYIVALDWKAFGMPRRSCMLALRRQGIQTQVHYIPIHHHPYYQQRDTDGKLVNCEKPVGLSNSERYAERTLSLPLFADMHNRDAERVVAALEGLRQCAST